ncbi:MAG: cardiolipin synthase, partial [Patescibacteria group bacterium]|nr:cardiolipin synthase [Patescibacteria group bacterium]
MLSFSAVLYISEWIIRAIMLLVVTRRREPASTMAWLLVIFFIPWLGLVLYWLIGENRLPRRRIEQHADAFHRLGQVAARFTGHRNVVRPTLGPEAEVAVTLAERLGYMPILGGNSVTLITDTDEVINRLVADIDAAERHIHLLFYIFAADATGRRVGDALVRAAQRGVACRLMVDAVGSRRMLKTLAPELASRGVEVHAALPVGLFRRRMARIDLRNHRKIAVFDGRIAYAGSQNIVSADYGHNDLAWDDIMVRLTGPSVLELQAVFVSDWYSESGVLLDNEDAFPEPEVTGDVPVQAVPSGPNYQTENFQRLVVAALYTARHQVVITTPYFVPDRPLMQALEVAVLRGVEVHLIVPRRSDQRIVAAASRAYYDSLLDAGVRLHLYDKGLLHSKTFSIDDRFAIIGSDNLDIRSFELNFELSLLFYSREVTTELRARQFAYMEHTFELTAERWGQRRAWKRLAYNIAKLMSPL